MDICGGNHKPKLHSERILSDRISKIFPNPFDFLDRESFWRHHEK